ncbi:MAG: hypothetical protein V1772_07455 [Chloroflexota bacterium]
MTRTSPVVATWLALGGLALALVGCGVIGPRPPAPTPDYPRLETAVAGKLMATLTAKAPTPTATPTHTTTPSPTATRPKPSVTPSPTAIPGEVLALVRLTDGQAANVVLYALATQQEQVLTHFAEPLNMSDLSWSRDGQWLLAVSSHDYLASRNNERNVFMLRADGTELRMVTGQHVDPNEAPGPYGILSGRVVSATELCRVYAQGAPAAVSTAEDGSFELTGVPLSAQWARAVCSQETLLLEGHAPIQASAEALAPITITVRAEGAGWRQASLSPDGQLIAGTTYTWTTDASGAVVTALQGVVYTSEGEPVAMLPLPKGATLYGLDWSPDGTRLVGALASDEGASLWLWDAQGASVGLLAEIANPESELLAAAAPDWSPDGARIAFELRRHYWWKDLKYRVDLFVTTVDTPRPQPLVESPWGTDATHPAWSADGSLVFYQQAAGAPAESYQQRLVGDVWAVPLAPPVAAPTPRRITADGTSALPAARPLARPTASPAPVPTVTATP